MSTAIARSKSNKVLGPEGFTSEWYKVMKDSLIPVLQSTKPPLLGGSRNFTDSKRERINEYSNFRSVSVLNQDYKIFTHVLTKRIERLLPQIISLDQTGFVCSG